jgi:cytochrome b6-f complex iron-sulfur subunit
MARKATRRTFVRNAALGSSAVVLAELTAGTVWLMWPNKTGEFGSEIPLSADTIPEVNSEPYRNVPGKFYLVHNQDGLLALYTKCPHLGCTVPWEGPPESDQAFQCPCHGSMYDYNGNRTGGPAPRPMDYMAISVNDDGSISVDTGDIRTRGSYEPVQAAPYPA